MQCLEVTINGERLCVAGADHVVMLNASVTYGALIDTIDRDKTVLSVHGLSKDLETDYYWGKEKFALNTGDIVTLRVLDDVVADSPIPFSRPTSVVKHRAALQRRLERQTRSSELLAGFDASSSELEKRASVRSMLFWCALILLGSALWWFFGP